MDVKTQDKWSFLTFDKLVVKPPIDSNSIKDFDPAVIAQDAKSTRIVVHPRFPKLVEVFLEHKRAHGSKYEKDLYATSDAFTWQNEVSRLIEKRPLVFMGGMDHTVLRDGEMMRKDTTGEWDRNGTDQQHLNNYLTLKEYLSYDEIMLSSLIGVSGSSYFINDGNRYNYGKPGPPGTFQDRGIIIGIVGARFEREDRMDAVHILPSVPNPHQDPRLSRIIQEDFFGVRKSPTAAFDERMYKARMRISIDILLLEANARAKDSGKQAYVYVVGLGLGVWQYIDTQAEIYITAFQEALALKELSLSHISRLEFAYINIPSTLGEGVTNAAAKHGIKAIFSRRNPAEKLETDELLVLSYAWDGNAFPGNEYWQGSLSGSGDPAAACMSTIGELHNPLLNPFSERIKVAGQE